MIVIGGLVVLLVAVIIGITGVLANAGAVAHPLTENFEVLGHRVTGSTGTLFLVGIVIGALVMLGLSALLAGAREPTQSQRETAFLNRDRGLLEHPPGGDGRRS